MNKWESIQDFASRGLEIFPLPAGKKRAGITGWPELATNNLATLAKWFAPGGSHEHGNWAVKGGTERTNPDTGQTEWLTIVDLDVKGQKDGIRALKAACEGAGLDIRNFRTLEIETPSGGFHLYFWSTIVLTHGTDRLGSDSGIDIRSDSANGYVVGPGSFVDGKEYVIVDGRPIANMGALASIFPTSTSTPKRGTGNAPLPGVDSDRAEERAVAYLRAARIAVEGRAGDDRTFKTAAHLKDLGCDVVQAFSLMLEHYNPRCVPPWGEDELRRKVENAYQYGKEAQGASAPEAVFTEVKPAEGAGTLHPVAALNAKYAFIKSPALILHETTNEDGEFTTVRLPIADFHAIHANKPFQIGKEKPRGISHHWMEWKDRREFDSVVFSPGKDPGPRFYNLWRGFTVQPSDKANHPALEAFKEHALKNVCQGNRTEYRYLISWFAHLVQRPWEKPLVALVFKGAKGVGKNALLDCVGSLLGIHYLVADDDRYLLGNFNSHLESNLFFVLDEASWAGDKKAEGKLKGLITGTKRLIEHKGKEARNVKSLNRIALIGNEAWIVPASWDERRYAVFNVGDGRRQDRKFFGGMKEGMARGGLSHLLRFLMDWDISDFDINAAPDSDALAEQKDASLSGPSLYWRERVSDGLVAGIHWTDGVCLPRRDVFNEYSALTRGRQFKFPTLSEKAFWNESRRIFHELSQEVRLKDRSRAVRLMPLAVARQRIVERLGVRPDWTTEEPEWIDPPAAPVSNAAQLFDDLDTQSVDIFN